MNELAREIARLKSGDLSPKGDCRRDDGLADVLKGFLALAIRIVSATLFSFSLFRSTCALDITSTPMVLL